MLVARVLFMVAAAAGLARSNLPIPITGLTTGINPETGELPIRRNINDLEAEGGPTWDLFIRALSALQNSSETDDESWFGVAGVHGQPYLPWNGVGPVKGGENSGFCPHGEMLFTPWHRPYMALYEQIIGAKVQQLAGEYTRDNASSSDYDAASRAFRIPYWDWASDARIPPSCTRQSITVNAPGGPVTIRNPLYSYRWQSYPPDPTLFPSTEKWEEETTRSPEGGDHFPVDKVNAKLAGEAESITLRVYRAFSMADTYEKMASTSGAGSSLEAPHNDIHNLVGGTFATLTVTSFDALFMLHHCNVDRLAAMWAVIHFDSTVPASAYASGGLFATAKGERVDADSPLRPFYQADGQTPHTSRSVADPATFGYTYPELRALDHEGEEEQQQQEGSAGAGVRRQQQQRQEEKETPRRRALRMIETVNRLYGSTVADRPLPGTRRPSPRRRNGQPNRWRFDRSSNSTVSWTAEAPPAAVAAAAVGERSVKGPEQEHEKQQMKKDWVVCVEVERAELALPCTINLFVGNRYAGRTTLLNMPMRGRLSDEIPLAPAIDPAELRGLGPDEVEDWLEASLRFEIKKDDGTLADPSSVPSLRLDVEGFDVIPPGSASEFPRYRQGSKHAYTRVFAQYNGTKDDVAKPSLAYRPPRHARLLG